MNNDNKDNNIGAIILFLVFLFIFFMFFSSGGQKKTTGGGGGATAPKETPCESPVLVLPEESPTVPGGGCPAGGPYSYCSTDTIEKVYTVGTCSASKRLVDKLIREGKLTGENDPKIVKCCKNPDLCPGIRKFPTVSCTADPLLYYEGYCP